MLALQYRDLKVIEVEGKSSTILDIIVEANAAKSSSEVCFAQAVKSDVSVLELLHALVVLRIAIKEKRRAARSIAMEYLTIVSGTRQITKAVAEVGLSIPGVTKAYIICTCSETCNYILSKLAELQNDVKVKRVLELSEAIEVARKSAQSGMGIKERLALIGLSILER